MKDEIKRAFDGIRAEPALKKRTSEYIANELDARRKRQAPKRALISAAACLLLVVMGVGGYQFYFTPVSVISVDAEQALELGVNRLDRVVTVKSYDEAGERLAGSVDVKHKNYADALGALLESGCMRRDPGVAIDVIGENDAKSEEMLCRIRSRRYAEAPGVRCGRGDREQAEEARSSGLSYGRYRAYLELKALEPDVTPDDVKGLSARQLRDRVEELSKEGGAHADEERRGLGRGGERRGWSFKRGAQSE